MARRLSSLTAICATITLLTLGPAFSADDSKPGEIKGMDVMGDKARSAQDGWSQAPVPREESAAKDAPNPGGKSIAENKDRPVPAAEGSGKSGTDPYQPLDQRAPGPSGINPAAPSK